MFLVFLVLIMLYHKCFSLKFNCLFNYTVIIALVAYIVYLIVVKWSASFWYLNYFRLFFPKNNSFFSLAGSQTGGPSVDLTEPGRCEAERTEENRLY